MATHTFGSPDKCPCEFCVWLVAHGKRQTTLLTAVGQQLAAVIALCISKGVFTDDELGVVLREANAVIDEAKAELFMQLAAAKMPTSTRGS